MKSLKDINNLQKSYYESKKPINDRIKKDENKVIKLKESLISQVTQINSDNNDLNIKKFNDIKNDWKKIGSAGRKNDKKQEECPQSLQKEMCENETQTPNRRWIRGAMGSCLLDEEPDEHRSVIQTDIETIEAVCPHFSDEEWVIAQKEEPILKQIIALKREFKDHQFLSEAVLKDQICEVRTYLPLPDIFWSYVTRRLTFLFLRRH